MELRMKEPHEKGLAIRSAPSFALGAAKRPVKRKQGKRWAGYRASKICNQGADAVATAEGNTTSSANASCWAALRSLGTRRIPDLETLRRESRAWNRRMNRARTKIHWKFDRKAARLKFR